MAWKYKVFNRYAFQVISKSFELILCKNPPNTLLQKFLHTFVIGSAGVNTTQYDTTEIVFAITRV